MTPNRNHSLSVIALLGSSSLRADSGTVATGALDNELIDIMRWQHIGRPRPLYLSTAA